MSQYFLARNGQTIGPFTLEDLPRYHLTAQDMVWQEGFDNWLPAGQVKEIAEGLSLQPHASTQGAYGGVQHRQQQVPYSAPQQNWQPPAGRPTSGVAAKGKRQVGLLVMGIFGLLLSVVELISGIGFFVGGVAMRDSVSYYSDNYYAYRESGEAMTIAGAILTTMGLFFLILSIIAVVNASQKRVKV